MCGRFTLKTPPNQWGQLLLPLTDTETLDRWEPRYNIAPTQNILAIVQDPGKPKTSLENRQLSDLRWGLIPGWATDLAIGNRMINARSETLGEKRSFRGPLENRRCLIVADGYYEWQKQPDGSKQPCWISPIEEGIVLFAGLWETNRRVCEREIRSCTIITQSANSALSKIHNRMPVHLDEQEAAEWLNPEFGSAEVQHLLEPSDESPFQVRHVSTHVNNPRHDDSDCLKP